MKIPDKYWTGIPLFQAGLPWLTPGAIQVLINVTLPSFRVLEFGGGGSTRFFTSRCSKVITWETDEVWIQALKQVVHSPNWTLSENLEEIFALDETFDVVLVDNNDATINRNRLNERALRFVGPEGWFILDNYSRYQLGFLAGWNIWKYDDVHWSGTGTLLARHH